MNLLLRLRQFASITFCVLLLSACEQTNTPEPEIAVEPAVVTSTAETAESVTLLADRYYAITLEQTPEVAYFSGVELARHDGMEDNSPESRKAAEALVDEMLNELESLDTGSLTGRSEWITHAYLLQELRASVALRVCRNELWNVNQMDGWHSGYAQIAQLQPTGTPLLRSAGPDDGG